MSHKLAAPKIQHLPPLVRAKLGIGHGRYLSRRWETWLGALLGSACMFIAGGASVAFLPPTIAWVGVLAAMIAGGGIYFWLTSDLSIRYYRMRLAELGLCPGCGYDLRASTDCCPECGEMIPQPSRPPDTQI